MKFPVLCEKELCTGCMACYNICPNNAIIKRIDDEGFIVPNINESKCVGCNKCVKVCPILNKKLKTPEKQTAIKGWAKDEQILRNSSSGGVFSIIANDIIKKKGVVYGAAFDTYFNVKHCQAENNDELVRLRGSKYVQSDIDITYKTVLKNLEKGINVLFTGTPCQVAGLNSFLQNKIFENLLTIDLVCHGVPSPKIFKSYIEYLQKRNGGKITSYNFRDKKWCWMRYNSTVTFSNDSVYYGKWETDAYMRGFLRELFLRKSCHSCQFANMNRQSDITLADFWSYHCKKGEIKNNERGCSLILLNSDKGRRVFENIKDSLISYPITLQEAQECNQSLSRCFPENPLRESFWRDFYEKGFEGVCNEYLYPEEISDYYKVIYKYGKDSLAMKLYKAKRFGKRVIRKLLKMINIK